jgi:hypothetical protein
MGWARKRVLLLAIQQQHTKQRRRLGTDKVRVKGLESKYHRDWEMCLEYTDTRRSRLTIGMYEYIPCQRCLLFQLWPSNATSRETEKRATAGWKCHGNL